MIKNITELPQTLLRLADNSAISDGQTSELPVNNLIGKSHAATTTLWTTQMIHPIQTPDTANGKMHAWIDPPLTQPPCYWKLQMIYLNVRFYITTCATGAQKIQRSNWLKVQAQMSGELFTDLRSMITLLPSPTAATNPTPIRSEPNSPALLPVQFQELCHYSNIPKITAPPNQSLATLSWLTLPPMIHLNLIASTAQVKTQFLITTWQDRPDTMESFAIIQKTNYGDSKIKTDTQKAYKSSYLHKLQEEQPVSTQQTPDKPAQ